jgi:hypothetical protein
MCPNFNAHVALKCTVSTGWDKASASLHVHLDCYQADFCLAIW